MSSGLIDDFGAPAAHPLVAFADAVESLLDETGPAPAWTLSPTRLQALLPRLTRAKTPLAEVELRVLAEADRHAVGEDLGATNTPAWWAHVTGQRLPAARAAAHLAADLDNNHEPARAALAAGRIQIEQARVIIAATTELPADLGPKLVNDAEQHLVGLADLDGETRLDPKALRTAGRKLLEVLAPDLAEDHERRPLEAEERHAAASAYLRMRPDGHGSILGTFKIPTLHGEILTKHLARSPHPATNAPCEAPTEPPARAPPSNGSPGRCGSVRRSASTSKPATSSSCPRPAGSPPAWWSP